MLAIALPAGDYLYMEGEETGPTEGESLSLSPQTVEELREQLELVEAQILEQKAKLDSAIAERLSGLSEASTDEERDAALHGLADVVEEITQSTSPLEEQRLALMGTLGIPSELKHEVISEQEDAQDDTGS